MSAERFASMLLAASIALGCGGAGMTSYTPVKEKTKFRDDQLFGAAERAIEKLGYMEINKDPDHLIVETREKEVGYSSVPRLFYRYAFHIEAKDGTLQISATCKQNSAMKRTEYEDCGEDRPQRVVDEQEELRNTILELAAKLP